MNFKELFGFGSSTPPPPPPPLRPPMPPTPKASPKPAPVAGATIVGRWKEPNGSDTTEFRADGTLIENPAEGETIHGRYSLDGTKLKVQLEGMAEELSFTVLIRSDILEMRDAEGHTTNYERI